MKCPHCLISIHESVSYTNTFASYGDGGDSWRVSYMTCPQCSEKILFLERGCRDAGLSDIFFEVTKSIQIYPKGVARASIPEKVKEESRNITEDYLEACLVLEDSPKASAALSRRCLQHILREEAKVKHGNLSNEIQQVLDGGSLPQYLNDSIDAVRNIGNFAAHPLKSNSTGEIVDVEPGEAGWLLDVIESLFDFYYVQPDILKKKKDELNKKLKDIGKPEMK